MLFIKLTYISTAPTLGYDQLLFSFMLFEKSFLLLWVTGCWHNLRSQQLSGRVLPCR